MEISTAGRGIRICQQNVDYTMISDDMTLMWRHRND